MRRGSSCCLQETQLGPGTPGQNAGEEKQLVSHFNFLIQKKFYKLFLAKWYVALDLIDSGAL